MKITDILGRSWSVECIGCAIGASEMIPPGGVIAENDSFCMHQDPLVPLEGFLVIASRRHVQSLADLTPTEYADYSSLLWCGRKALRLVPGVRSFSLVQEEASTHFHAWFFPWEISWGESNTAAIDAGLARCSAGIVVFTPEFRPIVGSGWRSYEYGGLINKMINGGARVGYALLRGEHVDVPVAMQDHFYADFRNPELFGEEFVKVYRGLLGRPLEDRPID